VATKPPGKEKFKAPLKGTPKNTRPLSFYWLYLVMALVTVVFLVGGYLFYHLREQQMRQRIEGGLSIVAQLKVEQIAQWRAERLNDADMLVGSPFFTEGVAKYVASPTDTEIKDKILARLAIIGKSHPYQDILLVDVNGSVLLNLNDSVYRLGDMTLAQLAVAIKEHKAVMVDFHYPPDSNSPHLDVVAPLFPWQQDSQPAIGAVVFCIDPSQYLYPLLQPWPIPSETAEILLVERDGDQVLFLNELRHQKDTALKLRIPLSQQEVPAVMAVLGKEGVVEGRDYRGAEVLAVLEHIPDSPWYMVAKIDTSEAISAWRFQAGIIVASVAGLLAAALAVIGLLWQRRQTLAYQALYQAELESQALRRHFEYLVKYANDIIFLTDENYSIIEANDRALETYGYTREEILGLPLAALMPPGDLPSHQARLRKIQQKGTIVAEAIHQRKNGSTFPVEVSGRTIKIEDKPYLQEIIRDITERKQAEEALKHLNLTLRAIRNVNQLISHEKDRNRLLEGICRCVVEGRGYQGAWVALLDESSKLMTHAQVGFGRSLLPIVEQLKQGILPRCGQQAMRQSEVAVIAEQCSTCGDCALSGGASGKAALTVRLEHSNTVYGLLNAMIPPHFITDEEIGLFRELANDCAFALYDIDLQDKHKASEESLRRSEQNFRDSIENSPLGMRIVNEDGKTLYANRALLDIWGYSSIEELEAAPRKRRYTPESYDEHRTRVEKRKRGEHAPLSYELSIVRSDGQVRYLSASRGELLWDGERQFQVVYQDITELKLAEGVLTRSEEKYRIILSEMQDNYFEVDLAGNLTFFNDSTSNSLGYSAEELMGMSYKEFTAKEDIEHVYKVFNEVYRTNRPNKGFSWKVVQKDGTVGFVEATVSPLRNPKGEIIGFRGVGREVTERKQAEEGRRQLELKAQVTSRLASVGEMAAGVAHEINNPLTGVIGFAQLLMDREDIPKDIRRDLAAINDGAQRVAGIVKRLLAFSRQVKPERKLVDINELIESTLTLRAHHLRVNNIKVTTQLAPDLPKTVADPGQLQQVLLNLIVNAETEMKLARGKGKLLIKTEKVDNIIRISFKDNGPGIAKKNLDRIFDPFFTTREVGQGTGLGLSLCHGIVAEHNGKIYVESKLGKGATFIMELPVVTEAEPPKLAEPVVEEPKKVAKARILVVDDEKVIRDLMKRVLAGEGYEVETVDNAGDALKKIEGMRYNLVLIDIKMPGMDGVELYKRIQKIAKSLARRVVFITGDIIGAATEKFLSETKAPHIDKPFNAEQLRKEVNRALTGG